MQFNNISDYEKMLMDRVTEVQCGDKTFFIRVAGPLNFNIIEIMSNQEIEKAERAAMMLCACLCDDKGVGLFNADNETHVKIVKEFSNEEVTILMNTIWNFFDKKKESEEVK